MSSMAFLRAVALFMPRMLFRVEGLGPRAWRLGVSGLKGLGFKV